MADDLHAEQTPGFKVGEKKTMDEYHQLGMFVFMLLRRGSDLVIRDLYVFSRTELIKFHRSKRRCYG